VGVQVPCGVYPEISQESDFRADTKASRADSAEIGTATGGPDRRRPPDGGPRSHDDIDSAEVLGFSGNWLHQR